MVSLQGDLIQHRTMIPWGLCEHVLQALIVCINYRLVHPFHVLSLCLHQTLEIVRCRLKDRAGFGLKVRFKSGVKMLESIGNEIYFVYAWIR